MSQQELTKSIVPISHYNDKTVITLYRKPKVSKPRKARTPDPKRIGDVIVSADELLELAKSKGTVIRCNKDMIPAAVIINWNFAIVHKCIVEGNLRHYAKERDNNI